MNSLRSIRNGVMTVVVEKFKLLTTGSPKYGIWHGVAEMGSQDLLLGVHITSLMRSSKLNGSVEMTFCTPTTARLSNEAVKPSQQDYLASNETVDPSCEAVTDSSSTITTFNM
jgi:hypothetical protein